MDELIEQAVSIEEKILWKGRRSRKVLNFYLFLGILVTILISLFFFSQGQVFHGHVTERSTEGEAVGLLALIVGLIISFLIYNGRKNTAYVITDKKTVIRHGGINADIIYVGHSDVKNMKINRGVFSRIFNVGTIQIDSGKKTKEELKWQSIRGPNTAPPQSKIIYDYIKKVENPQKVFNLIDSLVKKKRNLNEKRENKA
ncbi:MAG: PH domain-containing protein [Candidatus Nanoarchaeia archaeon]